MNNTLNRAVDGLSEVERLELLDYLRDGSANDADVTFDLSPAEKATLRARYDQLRSNPSAPTCTLEEIAAELGVRL